MIQWMKICVNLISHPKTARLAEELNLPNGTVNASCTAAGMMLSLWSWAMVNATNGDLSSTPTRLIAEAGGWRKSPVVFADALIASGFLDEDFTLHDWDDYTAAYMDLMQENRARTAERVRRCRAKKADTM